MGSINRQYLFALLFIGVGIYQIVVKDYLEFSLYAIAGIAFIVNALALEPKLVNHKKTLGIIAWILIIVAAILFLYLLQFKF
jgi:hypothetical protein